MIRQIAAKGFKFRTPRFVDHLHVNLRALYRCGNVPFVITEEATIELNKADIGNIFSGVEVDVLGYVDNIPFIIYVTYQGRNIPLALKSPEIRRCGVVEVNLDPLAHKFKEDNGGQYVDILRSYLEESAYGKSWIYHPRYEAARAQAEHELASRPSSHGSLPHRREDVLGPLVKGQKTKKAIERAPKPSKAIYKCVMCGSSWVGWSRYCKNCETHMFTTKQVGDAHRT